MLTMRHAGLRIGDTIALDKSRLNGTKLFLYTAKTGTPVYIPLPQIVVDAHVWQSARTRGEYTLAGCTVAPGFEFAGFEMAPPGWQPGGS